MFTWLAKIQGKDRQEVINEWHSFVIGFGEGFCLFTLARFPITEQALEEMEGEYHYYKIARGVGLAGILSLIFTWVWRLV